MVSKLIPRSKLDDEAVKTIVRGFAFGWPKTEIAAQCGAGTKAVQSVLLALRPRLLEPPFYKWMDPGDYFLTFDISYQETVERGVFSQFANCHFNKRCLSNFRQGRRKRRQCQTCPMAELLKDEESIERGYQFLDIITAFYQGLGIGAERGDRATIIQLRWAHTMIVRETFKHRWPRGLEKTANMSPEYLYETLIDSLETTPLKRP